MNLARRSLLSISVILPFVIALAPHVARAQQPSPQQTIKIVAGGAVQNVPATSIGGYYPSALAFAPDGDLLVAACTRIYRIDLSTGNLTTLAGNGAGCTDNFPGDPGDGGPALAASINVASAMVVDSAGDIIFADMFSNEIREMNASSGLITAVAGTGSAGFSGDGGPATQAQLNNPVGLAMDGSGNLYVADYGNGRVREIAIANGVITTVASLPLPTSVAVNSTGDLFVTRQSGTISEIVLSSGATTVIAGGGAAAPTDGAVATAVKLSFLQGLSLDPAGNIFFVSGTQTSGQIWEIPAGSPNLKLLAAGNASGATSGSALNAKMPDHPGTVVPGPGGSVFIAVPPYVYKVDSGGNLSVVLGNGDFGDSIADPSQPANGTEFTPEGVDASSGKTLFADSYGNAVISLGSSSWSIVAGGGAAGYSGDGGPASSAELEGPNAVITDAHGNVLIADTGNNVVREVNAQGVISTYAGNGTAGETGDGGPAASAELDTPVALALDAAGNLYIADWVYGASTVRRVDASTHVITTVAGGGTATTGDTGDGGPAVGATLTYPSGLAFDSAGNLYIVDQGFGINGNDIPIVDGTVRRVDAKTGIITTVAGESDVNGTPPNLAVGAGDGGPATQAGLSSPVGIAVDPNGNLLIADWGGARVREVLASNGNIYTLAGNGKGGASGSGGPGVKAELRPTGLSLDASGNLWITDDDSGRVWELANAVGAPALSPAAPDFGQQLLKTSQSLTVTITNPGLAAMTISGITAAQSSSADFQVTSNCGALTTGQSCTATITFTPTAAGAESASFTVANNIAPVQFSASGQGATASAASMTPSSLTFTSQQVNTTSAAQTVVLSDAANAMPLTSLSITTNGPFTETDNCGTTLASGGNCKIAVSFAPTAAGNATGALVVSDNAANSPQSITLSGTATAEPSVSLTPGTLTFASQITGSTSAAQNVTLANQGTGALAISSIAASAGFAETNTCGSSLAAGAKCTIAVTFAPTATGSVTGSLTINDNASDSPETLALSGTGADVSIAAASGSSTSATVNAGQPATFALQFTPVSGATGTFALTCSGAPTGAACTPSPASISLSGSSPVAASVNVTTTARSFVPPPAEHGPEPGPGLLLLAFGMLLLLALALTPAARRAPRWLAPLAGAALLALMVGCGGSTGTTPPPPPPAANGTPAGTYPLTLTATGPGGVTRTQKLTLTVN